MAVYGGPGREYDPWRHAAAIHLDVREGPLRRGRWGEYHRATHTATLAEGMTRREARSVLAHEVQHAIARDAPSRYGLIADRQEMLARRRAAALLVDPGEYRAAELVFGADLAAIADELDVIPEVLADWRLAVRSVSVRV